MPFHLTPIFLVGSICNIALGYAIYEGITLTSLSALLHRPQPQGGLVATGATV